MNARKLKPIAYRAKLNCQIGRDALEGKGRPLPPGVSTVEYALFCLLYAVEDLATFVEEVESGKE